MKLARWQVRLVILMLLVSASLYGIQIALGQAAETVFSGFLGNLAFLPIYILFVAIMLQEWLDLRERQATLHKLNMVIGAFFTEMGTRLVGLITDFESSTDELRPALLVNETWSPSQFVQIADRMRAFPFSITSESGDLEGLKSFLVAERTFILRLLENANVLEHESFTDLLWAVSHLAEELASRRDLHGLPDPDLRHLSKDMTRVYALLLSEWVLYLKHLKDKYPYLFSLAVRINPFDPNARPEIMG